MPRDVKRINEAISLLQNVRDGLPPPDGVGVSGGTEKAIKKIASGFMDAVGVMVAAMMDNVVDNVSEKDASSYGIALAA
jgi:hypothetical protein